MTEALISDINATVGNSTQQRLLQNSRGSGISDERG